MYGLNIFTIVTSVTLSHITPFPSLPFPGCLSATALVLAVILNNLTGGNVPVQALSYKYSMLRAHLSQILP